MKICKTWALKIYENIWAQIAIQNRYKWTEKHSYKDQDYMHLVEKFA